MLCSAAACADNLADGLRLMQSGDVAAATAVFSALAIADPDDAEAAYQLGNAYRVAGDLDQAVTWLQEAIERDATQSLYFQRLGEVYGTLAGQSGMFKAMRLSGRIRDSFERAVALDPDNFDARNGLVIYYLNAPAIAGGGVGKALAQAEEIGQRDARRGHLAFANIYSSQTEFAKAEHECRAAIDLDPEAQDAHLLLGILLTSAGRYGEAIAAYDEWLLTHPDDMQIRYQVGRTASIAGDYLEQGQAALESYLQHTPGPDEPGPEWANYRLGLIYQHQGREDAAAAAFRKALDIDPGHEQASAALDDLGES